MQWILQEFDDTIRLRAVLERLGLPCSTHKVVPFVGDLDPEPMIEDPDNVILFGAYTLWRYAERHNLRPGVFKLRPFVEEDAWHPLLLNGVQARIMPLREVPAALPRDDAHWFMRPVDDSKAAPGRVRSAIEIHEIAEKVLALNEDEIPPGALRHDTRLMFTEPAKIFKEWRVWVVDDRIVTYSLYKEGARVVYRGEIDEDAREFAQDAAKRNPDYSPAYVIDICRAATGLKILETNCLNSAGFYAADIPKLVMALEQQAETRQKSP